MKFADEHQRKAYMLARQAEKARPCEKCGRFNPSALIGKCNWSKADFNHSCFILHHPRRRKEENDEH